MRVQQTTQGGAGQLPPIPQMDKAAPRASSDAKQAAQEIRQAVKEIRSEIQANGQAPQAPVTPKIAGAPVQNGPANTTASTAPPAEFPRSNNDIPPEVIPMLGIVMGTITLMVLGFPIVRVLTRRFDRGTQQIAAKTTDVTPQLRQLQDSIDAMAIEIERISEGQRFTSKLLAERSDAKVAIEAPKQG